MLFVSAFNVINDAEADTMCVSVCFNNNKKKKEIALRAWSGLAITASDK